MSRRTDGTGLHRITAADFRRFQALIRHRAGIDLAEHKKALLIARLTKRLRALGLTSFRQYYDFVTAAGNERETIRMIEAVCTHETSFFREGQHFDYLENELYPGWRSPAHERRWRIRAWSAGCSTGEEPFSLAMSLAWHFPAEAGWSVEVLASDLSTSALARAREAVWSSGRCAAIPERYLKRFMLKGVRTQAGRVKAGPEIRRLVRFERHNLNADAFPLTRPFDLVFCRNVLMYFDPATQRRVIERLAASLAPGGRLFLGQAEGLLGMVHPLSKVGPAIYAPNTPRS